MRFDFSLRRLLPSRFQSSRPRVRTDRSHVTIEYPYNVCTAELWEEDASRHQETAELGKDRKWDELLAKLRDTPSLVNNGELPVADGPPIPFRTPLHYMAAGGAPEEAIEKIIEMGASKCMRTEDGRTAYDLAKSAGREANILELLKIPEEILRDEDAIAKMEAGLHSVINGRVENLIKKNKQRLPQLVLLFELCKGGRFYYPVPGMYGGFHVSCVENGIRSDSLIRICGGSEKNHFIDREGKVTLLPNAYPM